MLSRYPYDAINAAVQIKDDAGALTVVLPVRIVTQPDSLPIVARAPHTWRPTSNWPTRFPLTT